MHLAQTNALSAKLFGKVFFALTVKVVYLINCLVDVMICGGKRNESTCKGDSGGPLIAHVDGRFTLVGVTSWGKGLCNGRTVYADISHPSMMQFIKNIN